MSEASVLAVGIKDKMVVLDFPSPKKYAAFDPDTAKAIGEEMARLAYEIQYGKPPSQGSAISQAVRDKLIQRIVHVIRSTQGKQKSAKYVAASVVDVVLSEVL